MRRKLPQCRDWFMIPRTVNRTESAHATQVCVCVLGALLQVCGAALAQSSIDYHPNGVFAWALVTSQAHQRCPSFQHACRMRALSLSTPLAESVSASWKSVKYLTDAPCSTPSVSPHRGHAVPPLDEVKLHRSPLVKHPHLATPHRKRAQISPLAVFSIAAESRRRPSTMPTTTGSPGKCGLPCPGRS